jgi:GntR family transcriptional repressor for pyruvate dehydrogenase complex
MEDRQTRKEAVKVSRIFVPKPHTVLSDYLRDGILSGEFAEGDSLPSERQLVDQTGLSRGAVREALRTLSAEGLIHTRHGRLGGSIVTLPTPQSMACALSRFVQGRRIALCSVQETREVLEPQLARLAAERRTEEHLVAIRSLHDELVAASPDFEAFSRANVRWHVSVAQASGNELLSTLLYAISHGVFVATMAQEYDTTETRELVIKVHARVVEAIGARDADGAENSMRAHLIAANERPLALGSTPIPLTERASVPGRRRGLHERQSGEHR